MEDTEHLKAVWARIGVRTGAAGRAWRKSLVLRIAQRIPDTDARRADPAAVKREVMALRRARTAGHWSFQPERLRYLLALYIRARAARR